MTSFSSKIILFGEYGVIKGADALIIPFDKYTGHLELTGLEADENLWGLYQSLKDSRILSTQMNLSAFKVDVVKGLRFVSSIPQGMGLGSSGALCSAVFNEYAYDKTTELSLLKEYLSIMESHFHGKSSGIDPLVSFTHKCLFTDKDLNVKVIDPPKLDVLGDFYLLNSKIQRHTAPLVHSFLKDYSNPLKTIQFDHFIELSNECIQNIFDSDQQSFEQNLFEISKLQLNYFKDMIPKNLISLWQRGIDTKEFYLKLCGAGGGGYFICYSKNKNLDLENLTLIS